MSKKLYVGNLPFSVSEQELRDTFAKHGDVASASIVTDKFTGQSRGFGFVEMTNDGEAETAIGEVNGIDLGGRAIVVNEARPKERRDRPGGGGGGGGGRGGRGGRGGGGGGGRGRGGGGGGGGYY